MCDFAKNKACPVYHHRNFFHSKQQLFWGYLTWRTRLRCLSPLKNNSFPSNKKLTTFLNKSKYFLFSRFFARKFFPRYDKLRKRHKHRCREFLKFSLKDSKNSLRNLHFECFLTFCDSHHI